MTPLSSNHATQIIAAAETAVRVFHNNHAHNALLYGYDDGQTVTEVFSYTTRPRSGTNDHTLAEEAFELFNIGDDPTYRAPDPRAVDYRARGNRSLSVGDVIAVDGRFHACDTVGWRELIGAPPVQQTATPGTTPLY